MFKWRYCSSQAVPRIKGKADGSLCHINFRGTRIWPAVIHVGINDLLKCRTNINVSEIAKDIINIALRCRSHNIATILIASIVYSTKVSHTIIQKLNELLLDECTKYGFHLADSRAVSKENLWKDGVHLVGSGKVIIANNLLNCLNNFLGVANSVPRTR